MERENCPSCGAEITALSQVCEVSETYDAVLAPDGQSLDVSEDPVDKEAGHTVVYCCQERSAELADNGQAAIRLLSGQPELGGRWR